MGKLNFRSELNVRDLGGIPTTDGRILRSGLIYRSGGPYLMNTEELQQLQALHLKTILDLRTARGAQSKPDPILEGCQYLQKSGVVDVGQEIDFSPKGMRQFDAQARVQLELLEKYYANMPFANPAFATMFDLLLHEEVPLLVHCAAGKDRTGVAMILIEQALGVSREDTLQDYVLSNTYRAEKIQEENAKEREAIAADPDFAKLEAMRFGVRKEIGELVLSSIATRCGDLDTFFFENYGLDETKRTQLKNRYLQ